MKKNDRSLDMEEFRFLLKKHGLKVTPQRIAVHNAMLDLVHASVASVYNILTQLSLLGIYRHRVSSNNKMYFDVITEDHLHLYDTINHTYVDIMDDNLYKELEKKILPRRFKGYKIDNLEIMIMANPDTKGTK